MKKNYFFKQFTEKGFGVAANQKLSPHGEATIICNGAGEPLPMRLGKYENGSIAGLVLYCKQGMANEDFLKKHPHAYAGDLYVVKIVRKGSVVYPVNVRKYSDKDEISFNGSCCAIVNANEGKFDVSFDHTCQDGDFTSSLIDEGGVLHEAFKAAVNRSYSNNPKGLFFGKMVGSGTINLTSHKGYIMSKEANRNHTPVTSEAEQDSSEV